MSNSMAEAPVMTETLIECRINDQIKRFNLGLEVPRPPRRGFSLQGINGYRKASELPGSDDDLLTYYS